MCVAQEVTLLVDDATDQCFVVALERQRNVPQAELDQLMEKMKVVLTGVLTGVLTAVLTGVLLTGVESIVVLLALKVSFCCWRAESLCC